MATQAMFRIWRGDAGGGKFQDYITPVDEGMVVLDAIHRIQARAGAGSRGAMELQSRQMRIVFG